MGREFWGRMGLLTKDVRGRPGNPSTAWVEINAHDPGRFVQRTETEVEIGKAIKAMMRNPDS